MAALITDYNETDIRPTNFRPILSETGIEIVELVRHINDFANSDDKIKLLTQVSRAVLSMTKVSELENLLLHDEFNESLQNIAMAAFVQPFVDREYYSYDKDDFKGISDFAEHVLHLFVNIYSVLDDSNKVFWKDPASVGKELESHFTSLLPLLMILIGSNSNNPMWSSNICVRLSTRLLFYIFTFFSNKTIDSLLQLKAFYKMKCKLFVMDIGRSNSTDTVKKETLMNCILDYLKQPLSKELWGKNPYLSELFFWIILNSRLPHVSDHIGQVTTVSLNLLMDHQITSKQRGMQMLLHMMENVSGEELRWYNRADVIFDALKNQIHTNEVAVMKDLIPVLMCILKIVEKPQKYDLHIEVYETLLRQTEIENMLVMRRVLIKGVAEFTKFLGIHCVGKLEAMLRVISNYLEIEDDEQETSRLSALELLNCVLCVAWPRIKNHSEIIFKALMKLLIDVTVSEYLINHPNDVQTNIVKGSVKCLSLLNKIDPDIKTVLQSLIEEKCIPFEVQPHVVTLLDSA